MKTSFKRFEIQLIPNLTNMNFSLRERIREKPIISEEFEFEAEIITFKFQDDLKDHTELIK